MVASERYERDVRRALKALREATPEPTDKAKLACIGPVFLGYLGHLPVAVREELWAWYVERHTDGDPRFADTAALAQHLSGVVDVFDRAYSAERSPLDEDEWDLIHTLTNEGSPEMPMDTLQYVMQLLMDRGRLG